LFVFRHHKYISLKIALIKVHTKHHVSNCRFTRVGLHDVVGGLGWFCMELCPGGSLQQAIDAIPEGSSLLLRSPATCWDYMLSLAQGVVFLLGNSVLHRDLKPANILI